MDDSTEIAHLVAEWNRTLCTCRSNAACRLINIISLLQEVTCDSTFKRVAAACGFAVVCRSRGQVKYKSKCMRGQFYRDAPGLVQELGEESDSATEPMGSDYSDTEPMI